ncbi:MAG: ATP-binding protein, partial [Planctomycetaceae bacterium]|nr:ATP-binding protein [Planctomycetaceae bacterium]
MPKRPIRFFNTTGPCNPDDHYMLPPAERLQGAQLHRYIKDNLYWMLHAPRQTGKTTFLQSWMREINAGDDAIACYVSVERCQGMLEIDEAMANICESIRDNAENAELPVPQVTTDVGGSQLKKILSNWAAIAAPKPLIVLFDEVDVLEGDVMVSFLRQLRDGFAARDIGKFPVSTALVGMRDLKDYLVTAKDGKPVNPGSPFNIKEDSISIGNFSKNDIIRLFEQRTAETGQQITQEALDYVWEQSGGQPWIVNSLFKRATLRILEEDNYETVTLDHIYQAREQMILARETHLDSLAVRVDDPNIRYVMETLMTGDVDLDLGTSKAFEKCQDLGLTSIKNGTPTIANPIYREILARQITYGVQLA